MKSITLMKKSNIKSNNNNSKLNVCYNTSVDKNKSKNKENKKLIKIIKNDKYTRTCSFDFKNSAGFNKSNNTKSFIYEDRIKPCKDNEVKNNRNNSVLAEIQLSQTEFYPKNTTSNLKNSTFSKYISNITIKEKVNKSDNNSFINSNKGSPKKKENTSSNFNFNYAKKKLETYNGNMLKFPSRIEEDNKNNKKINVILNYFRV
jgi:hypothetical protein